MFEFLKWKGRSLQVCNLVSSIEGVEEQSKSIVSFLLFLFELYSLLSLIQLAVPSSFKYSQLSRPPSPDLTWHDEDFKP